MKKRQELLLGLDLLITMITVDMDLWITMITVDMIIMDPVP